MQTWQVTAPGTIELVERSPVRLAPGEVRVRVHTVSLNYRDLLVLRGHYDPNMAMPRVPCSDLCGTVMEAGPDSQLPVGTRVVCSFHTRWLSGPLTDDARRGDLGGSIDGVLQEQVVVPEAALVPAPRHLSDVQACTLPCAGVTAWRSLVVDANLQPGQTVLTLGTGGVSLFAVQLAKALGADVAITSSSDAKLARAKALGADHGVNYTTTPQWGRAVRAWRPADVVIELGGAGTLKQSLAAVTTGGHIALIGVLDGVRAPVLLTRIVMRAIRVQGVVVGSREDLADLCAFLERHPDLLPVVHDVVPFEHAGTALHALADGAHMGKVVVQTRARHLPLPA